MNQDHQRRGKIQAEDLKRYKQLTEDELENLLFSDSAVERSVAAVLLRSHLNSRRILLLMKSLKKEDKLYARLEICKTLESGGIESAGIMIENLGMIGDNQYHSLPNRPSSKKSYPLPRDIIARSLGRMDPEILPEMLSVLDGDEERKVSEILDAIGYMVFYNPEVCSEKVYQKITQTFDKYQYSPVIQWKCLTCLSAFPFDSNQKFLLGIIAEENNPLFVAEAKRSYKLIFGRQNNVE